MEYTTHFVENKDARQHHSTFHLFSLQLHIYISFKLQLQQRIKISPSLYAGQAEHRCYLNYTPLKH